MLTTHQITYLLAPPVAVVATKKIDRTDILLNYLREQGTSTCAELCEFMECSDTSINKMIKELMRNGNVKIEYYQVQFTNRLGFPTTTKKKIYRFLK